MLENPPLTCQATWQARISFFSELRGSHARRRHASWRLGAVHGAPQSADLGCRERTMVPLGQSSQDERSVASTSKARNRVTYGL